MNLIIYLLLRSGSRSFEVLPTEQGVRSHNSYEKVAPDQMCSKIATPIHVR
ncbi:MAG: hypothetical protein F6K22_26895 [Okeania sp. SIO2F4]|uniref:hypothetical protein n=1 Tax=Okeania sp. SIO2F4 TaxID=2607790 RepID=UPI00142C101A|nr:hypothetical protein [Okeania sp. SIO2F4]NES06116.1 hypothetical protein [Okeania sp. SIO2F4]